MSSGQQGSALPARPVRVTGRRPPSQDFSQHDEELLTSGLHSDVKVICGDQQWLLHQPILSSRCRFFKAGLVNNFLESRNAEFPIYEREPYEVDWLVTCIYTGKATSELDQRLENPDTLPDAAKAVTRVADFFCYDELDDLLVGYIRPHFDEAVAELQQDLPTSYKNRGRASSNFIWSNPPFVDLFFRLAEALYDRQDCATRKPAAKLHHTFMEFFNMTRFAILDTDDNRERLERIPNLAVTVLTFFMKGQYAYEELAPPHEVVPSRCEVCHSPRGGKKEGQKPRIFVEFWHDDCGTLCGRCKTCLQNDVDLPWRREERLTNL